MGSGDTVLDALDALNIDTTATPRTDSKNDALPDTYAPLGPRATLAPKVELFVAGPTRLEATESVAALKYLPTPPDEPDRVESRYPALEGRWKQHPLNAAAAADIDNDGLDEMIVVWWDEVAGTVQVQTIDFLEDEVVESVPANIMTAEPKYLWVLGDNFRGRSEESSGFLLALEEQTQIRWLYVEQTESGRFSASELGAIYEPTQEGSELGISWSTGQLDRDPAVELALIVNETSGSGRNGSPGTGTSHLYIYDDVHTEFSPLVEAERVVAVVDATTYDSVTADVALGDVDGDGVDEVVIGGLADRFSVECESIQTLELILDDAGEDFTTLATYLSNEQRINSCESSGNNGWTSHVWVDALDIDGDQIDEFHVSGVVFEDLKTTGGELQLKVSEDADTPWVVDARDLFAQQSNNGRLRSTRANTAITVGDFTADGYADIIAYMPGSTRIEQVTSGNSTSFRNAPGIVVWGVDPLSGEFVRKYVDEFESLHDNEEGPPFVVPLNLDGDSTILRYSEGTYELVFSEPIVHAALAAPPCADDGSQVTDVCQTSWGTGATTTTDASLAHEIRASYHMGVSGTVSVPIVGDLGVEVEKSVGVSLRVEASLSYQLTKTITYTSGAMEDTVVATVVPYDRYTYIIESHPLYPELVGEEVIISLPRAPVTLQVERERYNEAVGDSAAQIGSEVFGHAIGDPSSYPTTREKDSAVDQGAKEVGPVTVGLSSGNSSVEISESTVAGFSVAVGISVERTVKVSGGKVMAGFSVGSETTASLGFSVGETVTFQGTVGDTAASELDQSYDYGMFVYTQEKEALGEFQVINYWVE